MGYSASNVSTSISLLEKKLGVILFTRKPLKLTEIGEEIYETVKNGFSNIDFAFVLAKSKNELEYGKLAIGCPSHIVQFYLMQKVSNVLKDYKNLQIDLNTEINKNNLISYLKDNLIDFAITDSLPIIESEDIVIKELKPIEYIFVSKEKIDIKQMEELNKYKFILAYKGKKNTRKLFEALKYYDLNFETSLRCPTTEQRIDAAKRGLGIAFVIKDSVKNELEKGELYEVKIPAKMPTGSISIVYLKGHLTKTDKEFMKKYLD